MERYTAVVGDDDQSLVTKRQLADEMLALILRLGITAQDLLPQITTQANDRDGWLVALASLVAVAPAPGDGSRLLEVASLASQDFAKYRILLAIYSLKVRGRLTEAETTQARPFVLECIKSKNEMLARGRARCSSFSTRSNARLRSDSLAQLARAEGSSGISPRHWILYLFSAANFSISAFVCGTSIRLISR